MVGIFFFFFWFGEGKVYWFCLVFFFIIPNIIYTKSIGLTLSPPLTHHCLGLKWSEELVEVIKSFPRDKVPLWLGLFHSPNLRCLGKAPFL